MEILAVFVVITMLCVLDKILFRGLSTKIGALIERIMWTIVFDTS